MSILLSPLTIKNTTLKNRIVISPMCQYTAVDGFANSWHLAHLGARAIGGAALIIQEATAVVPEGRITYGDLGIWKDEHIDKLKEIVDFVHTQDALVGVQLAHAGRKGSCQKPWDGGKQIPSNEENGWQTVGPSPVAFLEEYEKPLELDKAGIQNIINAFVTATKRVKAVGYDVVEIHGAHGYLFHQFFSPLSNFRTDEYGGSFENRIRFLLETVDAVKAEWGTEKPLFVRISATDWTEGGWTIEDSLKLATILKEKGIDAIDTSTGGNVLAKIPGNLGYQVPFAAQIKKEVGIITGAVGLINNPHQAEQILQDEEADLIFIARESLRNPNFPLYAATILGDEIIWPVQYERAIPTHGEWK